MPSRTSSSAFSAAALFSVSWSTNSFANRRDAGRYSRFVAEYRTARHEHSRSRLHRQRGGSVVDATVAFDLHLCSYNSQPPDLIPAVGDGLLPAESPRPGHPVHYV